MNIAEIIELVRGLLREEDLVPVKELKDKNFVDEVSKRFHLPTYEQIEELAKKLETSVEYFVSIGISGQRNGRHPYPPVYHGKSLY